MITCAKALELGERCRQPKSSGLCLHLADMGMCRNWDFLLKVLKYGERAQKIAESFPSDQYIFFKSLSGLCYINYFKGDTNRVFEGAKRLLDYGDRNANSRCNVFGHWMKAFGHEVFGDTKLSQTSSKKAMEVALDPAYAEFPKVTLGLDYFFSWPASGSRKSSAIQLRFQ